VIVDQPDTAEMWWEWTDAATWRAGDDEAEEER
jgi:hypothetical protein